MTDERVRAYRAAFCAGVGDVLLAAACSAAGGAMGLLLFAFWLLPLAITTACLAFVAGLVAAVPARMQVGTIHRHALWVLWWVAFGIPAGMIWTRLLFGGG
jgi:hypothetical protein